MLELILQKTPFTRCASLKLRGKEKHQPCDLPALPVCPVRFLHIHRNSGRVSLIPLIKAGQIQIVTVYLRAVHAGGHHDLIQNPPRLFKAFLRDQKMGLIQLYRDGPLIQPAEPLHHLGSPRPPLHRVQLFHPKLLIQPYQLHCHPFPFPAPAARRRGGGPFRDYGHRHFQAVRLLPVMRPQGSTGSLETQPAEILSAVQLIGAYENGNAALISQKILFRQHIFLQRQEIPLRLHSQPGIPPAALLHHKRLAQLRFSPPGTGSVYHQLLRREKIFHGRLLSGGYQKLLHILSVSRAAGQPLVQTAVFSVPPGKQLHEAGGIEQLLRLIPALPGKPHKRKQTGKLPVPAFPAARQFSIIPG